VPVLSTNLQRAMWAMVDGVAAAWQRIGWDELARQPDGCCCTTMVTAVAVVVVVVVGLGWLALVIVLAAESANP
jgi:hypothetical protein